MSGWEQLTMNLRWSVCGHPRTPENTTHAHYKGVDRPRCSICNRMRVSDYKRAKREERMAG